MKKPLIAIVAVVAIGGAVAAYRAGQPAPDLDSLRISGNIEITSVEVAFRIPGRVVERAVDEGEWLDDGQVVARLDDTEYAHEVGLRRAELGAATAQLAELNAGFRAEEIAQARAALARVQADAERTRVEFKRQQDLFAREVISEREFETAQAADRMISAQVEEAGQRLGLLESGPRPEQIEQARHRVRQAEEALALAETRLSYTVLTSPLAGLVLAKQVEAGEQVAAGTPVVTVGDLTSVWLRGYIDETDLGRVKTGQRARVTTDTYRDRTYEGVVSFISSEAEFTPKSVQTTKERVKLVYRIKIDIENPAHELKPGMPADADLALGGE
jgi:HlyD family secretion protein